MTVVVVDYGAGNTPSVIRALEHAGAEDVVLSADSNILLSAERLVLPGVGASRAAMEGLVSRGLVEPLSEAVLVRRAPILGICVGMQLMMERLTEFGDHRGLGWFAGDVVAIPEIVAEPTLRVPHMGWNRVDWANTAVDLFPAEPRKREFYFAHSFAVRPQEPSDMVATVDLGAVVCVGLRRDNILAFQFHPEKSQINGRLLLRAFLDWTP